VKAEKLDR